MSAEQPQNTEKPLDQAYANAALARIREAASGAGLKPEHVTIESFSGQEVAFKAELTLSVNAKTSAKTLPGKKTGGVLVSNAGALSTAIEKDRQAASGSETARQIRSLIEGRADKGFGMSGPIALPFLNREYIIHEGCRTCQSKGELMCRACVGKGYELCPRCNGDGAQACSQCNGAQNIWNGQSMVICSRCAGRGRMACTLCNERRRVKCRVCASKGVTTCGVCNGQGWNSQMTLVEFSAVPGFDYERNKLPEKLARALAERGRDMASFAAITLQPPEPPQPNTSSNESLAIQYHAKIPYAEIGVNFAGRHNAHFFLLGPAADIIDSPAFLDVLLKPGIDELKEAAKGQGNVANAVRRAAKHRVIRQGLTIAAKHPKAKASRLLLKNNPLGLSQNAANTIIAESWRAIGVLTAKPRRMGLLAGLGIAALVYGGYFLSPARSLAMNALADPAMHYAADGAVCIAGFFLAAWVVRTVAAAALKKSLIGLLPPGKEGSIMPRNGAEIYIIGFLCLAFFLAAAEATIHFGVSVPEWYAAIRNNL